MVSAGLHTESMILTYWDLDKIADIEDIFKCIFLKESICILTIISLWCVADGSIDDNLALAWQ